MLENQANHPPLEGQLRIGNLSDAAFFGHHPLLLFNGEVDCLTGKLRPGNVHQSLASQALRGSTA